MPRSIARPLLAAVALGVPTLLVAACTSDASGNAVEVTGTDDACTIASTEVTAGSIEFDFTNQASKTNELYILRENGDVVGEVENVTPGITRTLTADLSAGEYQVKCKPGMAGKGFTDDFTVTGSGGTKTATPDRTITFDAADFTYTDLDLEGIATGDTIRFEMTNGGDQPHEFEVLDPDGTAVGEVAAVEPGETGGAVITFDEAGTYTYQCILKDEASGKEHTMLGMKGTFDVSS